MKGYRVGAQASLAVVVAIAIITVSVSVLVSTISYNHYANQHGAIEATKAMLIADSALEDALLKYQQNASYNGGTFTVPEGAATVATVYNSVNSRLVNVETTNMPVKRRLSTNVNVRGHTNPLGIPAIFASEDIKIVKSNAMLVGNLWSNDNLVIDESSIVQGNVYASGQGNMSSTRIVNGGRVEDNPNTPEVEGNIYAIDRIRITNNGYVSGAAISRTGVTITSGGHAGSTQTNPNLTVPTHQIPTFRYSELKSIAQSQGTYFTSPNQFLNYLSQSGNTTTGGIYYIESTQDLTFASGTTYNIVGTIVSHGNINIYSTNYTHTRSSNYPVLVSQRSINFLDQNPCNCKATVTGVIFAEYDIVMKHDQYTGSGLYAIQITGGIAAGDQASIEDHTKVISDVDMLINVQGFNTGPVEVPPSTDNVVSVTSWQIN